MIGWLKELFWPRRCEVGDCGRPVDRPGRHLCSDCLMRLPFIPLEGACRVCGRAVEGMTMEYLCEDCARASTRPAFDRAASALRFEGEARRMALDYKFNRHLWLRDDFVDWLEAAARARFDLTAVDVVVSMPLTILHRLDRGYDQCACLASELARRLGRRYAGGALARTGHPRRQAGLDEEARRENVRGTFAVRDPGAVRGRTVLVVDDVMSTGATFSECARALKSAGVWRVWCVSLVRSVRT